MVKSFKPDVKRRRKANAAALTVQAQNSHRFWFAAVVASISVAFAGLVYKYVPRLSALDGAAPKWQSRAVAPGQTSSVTPTPKAEQSRPEDGLYMVIDKDEGSGGDSNTGCGDLLTGFHRIAGQTATEATDSVLTELLARDAERTCIGNKARSRLLTGLMHRAARAEDWIGMGSYYNDLLAVISSLEEKKALWWDVSTHYFLAARAVENNHKENDRHPIIPMRLYYRSALDALFALHETSPKNATILGNIAIISDKLDAPDAIENYHRYFK